MIWPTAGSQVNVPAPKLGEPDEADPDDDPGTTTVYDPASPERSVLLRLLGQRPPLHPLRAGAVPVVAGCW